MSKCPCCGSRQFISHQSKRVCSYCRSEQGAEPVVGGLVDQWKSNRNAIQLERVAMFWTNSVLRHDKVVRIKAVTP